MSYYGISLSGPAVPFMGSVVLGCKLCGQLGHTSHTCLNRQQQRSTTIIIVNNHDHSCQSCPTCQSNNSYQPLPFSGSGQTDFSREAGLSSIGSSVRTCAQLGCNNTIPSHKHRCWQHE